MRICILTPQNVQVGFLDNTPPRALHYYDDTLHRYLKGTADTLEFKSQADHEDSSLLESGNKLTFVFEEREYYLTIVRVVQNEKEITVSAWGSVFEFINETALPYSGSEKTFEEFIDGHKFEFDYVTIDINEVKSAKRSNEWTSNSDTILTRLYSIATLFDAEIEFLPMLDEYYALDHMVMNIYKEHDDSHQGIGYDRTDIKLRYGTDISGITRTMDITKMYTGIRPYGKDGLTLVGYEKTELDSNGKTEYYTPSNSDLIIAEQARKRYPSNIDLARDGVIVYHWTTEYTTQADLYGNALAKLKIAANPVATYEVEGVTNIGIGDLISIIDSKFSPPLEISVRVAEQEISFTDPKRNKTTFSNAVADEMITTTA